MLDNDKRASLLLKETIVKIILHTIGIWINPCLGVLPESPKTLQPTTPTLTPSYPKFPLLVKFKVV